MNNVISAFYQQAQFSLAAYANLVSGGPSIQALTDAGMGALQAATFAQTYEVVDRYDGLVLQTYIDDFGITQQAMTPTGLSATIFRNRGTGEVTLAIRGTDDLTDMLSDAISIGVIGSTRYQTQYAALRFQVQEWLGNGKLGSGFTVTGHSLGGFLATGLTADFGSNITHAYLYNSPGIGSVAANLNPVSALLRALEVQASGVDTSKITNLRADSFLSLIAGVGTPITTPTLIHIENQTSPTVANREFPALNHSQATLTEALAVYDLFARIKPDISVTEATAVLKAAAHQPGGTLEQTINPLLRLFGLSEIANLNATRDELYRAIGDLQEILPQPGATSPYGLVSLVDTTDLATRAQNADGLAYRYALNELNPYAVIGADYGPFNSVGQIDGYDAATGQGTLTDAWLADRAELLRAVLTANVQDNPERARLPNVGTVSTEYHYFTGNHENILFADPSNHNPADARQSIQVVEFADDAGRTLTGIDNFPGDHLYGGGGGDTLTGNGGNDYLEGGKDFDTYVYATGDGFDTIVDTDGQGAIVFDGVTLTGGMRLAAGDYISSDKRFRYEFQGDLETGGVLVINGNIRVENFKNDDLGIHLSDESALPEIQPSGQPIFIGEYIPGYGYNYFGSPGNDYLVGRGEGSLIIAEGGDDLLVQETLDPGIDGGVYYGDAGNDVLIWGNEGQLSAYGGPGADIIIGGDQSDDIWGDMYARIDESANRIIIDNFQYNLRTAPDSGNYFWDGYVPDSTHTFQGSFAEALNFALGITPATDIATLYDDFIDGGAGRDFIYGGFGSDILLGGDGNDRIDGDRGRGFSGLGSYANLFGQPGGDYLDGGNGNDRLTDRDGGDDTFIGGDGDDEIDSEDPVSGVVTFENYLEGGDGNDTIEANNLSVDGFDMLVGGTGDDLLTTVNGNAFLDGGLGNDTYVVSHGHAGSVTIQDHDSTPGNLDQLVLGDPDSIGWPFNAILPSEVAITRDESNLYLGFDGVYDKVALLDWFVSDADRIEQILFQDRTVWDVPALIAMATQAAPIDGAQGDDFLYGINGATNSLNGGAGNDSLSGGDLDDQLTGGTGNDVLAGGAGNDTYVFNPGDGADHIQDDAGTNTLRFGAGITPDMLTLGLGSLMLRVGGGSDAIHLDDFDPGDVFDVHTIESLWFEDGTSLTYSELVARGFDIFGTDGNDTMAGTNVSDRFYGGPGDDTYLYGRGSGQDQIDDSDVTAGNSDTLRIGAGVAPDDLEVSRTNDALLISIHVTQDQLVITNWFQGDSNKIERIVFEDGTLWDAATLQGRIGGAAVNPVPTVVIPLNDQAANVDAGNTLDGPLGSNRLLGSGGDDTFQYIADAMWTWHLVAHNEGSPGNPGTNEYVAIAGKNRSYDVFEGGRGIDVLLGTGGDDALFLDDRHSPFPSAREPRLAGIERIEGGSGDDVIDLTSSDYGYGDVALDGGEGNDVLWASGGVDVLSGGPGNDRLFGGAGNNYLNGGAGTDALTGGTGNELFIGGTGNDTIIPNAGADIIAFNRGDGQDAIDASRGADNTLSIGGGIRYADMTFTRNTDNLVLNLGGGAEQVTLTNWYASSPAYTSVLNLQVIAQAMADFNASSADPLLNKKVANFDFPGLASAFDAAGAPANWALTNALLAEHLSGSDTAALGGDLAYRYGLSGSLADAGFDPAVSVLSNAYFGTAAQAF